MRTGGQILVDNLLRQGVDLAFCVPGESYIGLTSALIERNSVRVIVCRHEGGAGYMAVADGRLRAYAVYLLVRQGIKPTAALSNVEQELSRRYPQTWPTDLAAAYLGRKSKIVWHGCLAVRAWTQLSCTIGLSGRTGPKRRPHSALL